MGNMSYCRFENTHHDLQDCYDALIEDPSGELSESESKYKDKLIRLCEQIAADFGREN